MKEMFLEREFFVHTFDVSTKDTIRPSAIFDYFQDVAALHADELNIGFQDLYNLDLYWVILYEELEIKDANISFGSYVKARTWPKSRTRLEFVREYELLDSKDSIIATGISSWCVINTKTRRLERADKVIIDGEYYPRTNYPDVLERKLSFSFDSWDLESDYKVLLSDLDHNMHLNNAKYFDIIYNMQASSSTPKKIRITFNNEAHVNEIIHLKYKRVDQHEYYMGIVNDKVCFMAEITIKE